MINAYDKYFFLLEYYTYKEHLKNRSVSFVSNKTTYFHYGLVSANIFRIGHAPFFRYWWRCFKRNIFFLK